MVPAVYLTLCWVALIVLKDSRVIQSKIRQMILLLKQGNVMWYQRLFHTKYVASQSMVNSLCIK